MDISLDTRIDMTPAAIRSGPTPGYSMERPVPRFRCRIQSPPAPPQLLTAANLADSYVTSTGTFEKMAGGGSIVFAGGNGAAAGTNLLYYNSGTSSSPTWTAIGNGFSDADAYYSLGGTTVQIGFVSGLYTNTTGATTATNHLTAPASPSKSTPRGQVFGFSKFYGGATSLTGSNGQDLWVYDPNNATGAGLNGTILLQPTAPSGYTYTGGNSTLSTPQNLLNDSGQIAAAYQEFASTDTNRVTAVAQDAYIYTPGSSPTYTQVGLTGSAYTFYQGTGTASAIAAGVGGSNFQAPSAFTYLTQYPALNANGQAVGYTKRTAAQRQHGRHTRPGYVRLLSGRPSFLPMPPAGTTQIGLTGGVYSTNTGTGITQSSGAAALSTSGAVAGYSQRYQTATATTSAGQDAWYYDPARGITAAVQIGLTGANYEFTPAGATNNYRSSTITALGQNGMVGGYSYRDPTGTNSSTTSGYDAWVYDAATHHTYNVDPNTSNTLATSPNYVYSTIAYISDSGVALGYDYTNPTNGSPPTPYDKLFEFFLSLRFGRLV